MPDQQTLQQWLTEAELALHQLLTGSKPVQVRFSDHDVRFIEQSNVAELKGYIADLKRQLGMDVPRRRPITPIFGS